MLIGAVGIHGVLFVEEINVSLLESCRAPFECPHPSLAVAILLVRRCKSVESPS